MSSVVVTSFYHELKRHGTSREQARKERASKAMSMSLLESSTNSPFGVSYTASRTVDRGPTPLHADGAKKSTSVSTKNGSYNKWVSSTADNWTKTNLRASHSVGSDNLLKTNSKQLSSQSFRSNGRIKDTKPRSSSFEDGIASDLSADKPVLRRWLPSSASTSDEEKLSLKNRKAVVSQGSVDKFKFKPVVSLLSRTPWQNDFVKRSNSLKLKSGDNSSTSSLSGQEEQQNSRRQSRDVDNELLAQNGDQRRREETVSCDRELLKPNQQPARQALNGQDSGKFITDDFVKEGHPSDKGSSLQTRQEPIKQTTLYHRNDGLETKVLSLKVNGTVFDHNHNNKVDPINIGPSCNGGQLSQALDSSNSDIWIKRQSQELPTDNSNSAEESECLSNESKSLKNDSSYLQDTEELISEQRLPENTEDMSYSSRYYSGSRSSSYRTPSSPSYDSSSYRSPTRTRAASPDRTFSYRATYDSPSVPRYSTLTSYGASYSRKSFDYGDDDTYGSRLTSSRNYSSTSRDLSTTSSSYRSMSRESGRELSSPSPGYKSYRKDSYEKDKVTSTKSLDSSSYESSRYDSGKYSGSRTSDYDVSSSVSSGRKASYSESYSSRSRYKSSLPRQESTGYDESDVFSDSYGGKYSKYTSKRSLRSDDYSSSKGLSGSSYSSDRKYDDISGLSSRTYQSSSYYTPRDTTGRRYSEDGTSSVSKDAQDGFEKSSFIRRSLKLGKTKEKSEDREVDDQSSSKLSRLRSSLKWSHTKEKEDETRKEKADEVKKDNPSSPSSSSFLKRSSKSKKSKSSAGTDGFTGSRPTSPSSEEGKVDSDRALSPETVSSEFSPTTKKNLDDKKDKVSFFKRLRKSSRGPDDAAVSSTEGDKEVSKYPDSVQEPTDSVVKDIETPTSPEFENKDIRRSLYENVDSLAGGSERPLNIAPIAQQETDFDDLEMWSKTFEKDLKAIDSAISDLAKKKMGNVQASAGESGDTPSQPSAASATNIVKDTIVTGSHQRKVDEREVLKSLSAPSKALPKREEILTKDINVVSSRDIEHRDSIPQEKPVRNGVLDSYVILDDTRTKPETSSQLSEEVKAEVDKQKSDDVEPSKEVERTASTSRSRFVRTHGSAKDRIREKKLRKEQEEHQRALAAARMEQATDSGDIKPMNGDVPTGRSILPEGSTETTSSAVDTVEVKATGEAEGITTLLETTSNEKKGDDKTISSESEPKPKSAKGKRRILRRSHTLVSLPRTQDSDVPKTAKDDADVIVREKKKIIRPRPKTLTQGIDPNLIFSQGKTEEEDSGVVEEQQLSLKELKMKFLSGNFENKAKPSEKKEKEKEKTKAKRSRSGKRYKTITEGIAPGILDAARQLNDDRDVEDMNVQNDHLSRLTAALTTSTQDVKRRSYLIGENGSVPGSRTSSLATSVEDLSKNLRQQKEKEADSKPVSSRTPLRDTQNLTRQETNEEEEELPTLSDLKNRFLKAVVETEQKHKQKSFLRTKKKSHAKERPHTICGLDDWTFQKIQDSIAEPERENISMKLGEKSESLDVEDSELEEICKLEGLSPEELAAELGCDPSLHATRYEKEVHQRHSKALKEYRARQEEERQKLEESPSVPEPGIPKRTLSVSDDSQKKRRSGVFEPVDVMKLDDDAKKEKEEKEKRKQEKKMLLDGTESELDFLSLQSTEKLTTMTASRRLVRPQRKHKTTGNPLKSLNKRSDLVDEKEAGSKKREEGDTETGSQKPYRVGSGLSQKSLGQKLWRKVALANEAKSALASIEDFSSVKLRKVKSPEERRKDEIEGFQGSRVSNILIHVKGRRHVQCRLVDFDISSFNSGDSFVIVTPTSLHCWHGKKANVIEKAKAAEIASRIQQKREMGCKALDVVYYEQGGPGEERVFRPFEVDSVPDIAVTETQLLDEDYEKSMILSNMVYTVQNTDPPELVPVVDMCHRMPSKEILKTDEAFVFDFVSEMYVWVGRQTTSVLRKTIQTLAKAKFDAGYFKPSAVTSYAHLHGRARKISLKTEGLAHGRKASSTRRVSLQKQMHDKENLAQRPPYSIILVMFEGAEWVLFREKFSDWPDESRIIRMKGGPQTRGEVVQAAAPVDIKVLDPEPILKTTVKPQTYVFEGTAVERGQGRPQLGIEGYHIVTKDVKVWFITEHKHYLLPPSSHGHFHSGEGYVIRWEYSVVPERVMRTLSDKSQAASMGRQKCAYFFWLGNDCSVTEQAATAVMTVELDEERGPQVRVLQGKEPPCLLNIFNGGMVIHAGKRPLPGVRKNFTDRSLIRLYCVRNEMPNESCLLQVPVSADSLRSRSSCILLLCGQGEIFIWHGCKVNDGTRSAAIQAAHRLVEQHPVEAALADRTEIGINEIEEGHEPEVFWVAIGGEEEYGSLLLDINTKWDFTPRLFQLLSATGEFLAHEVACPSITDKYNCPFPFLQDDLYNSDQPSIFLLDAHSEVYLWFGWWPDDEEAEITSSMYTRWDIDKRKAMESALLYAQSAGRSLAHTYVVYAGLEPDSFIWLFPYWVVQEDITDIQLEEGREQDTKLLITQELEVFCKDNYTLEELQERPLPQGVDPTRLETYLSDDDFMALFHMDREEFLQLPTWKKANIKKKVGLY